MKLRLHQSQNRRQRFRLAAPSPAFTLRGNDDERPIPIIASRRTAGIGMRHDVRQIRTPFYPSHARNTNTGHFPGEATSSDAAATPSNTAAPKPYPQIPSSICCHQCPLNTPPQSPFNPPHHVVVIRIQSLRVPPVHPPASRRIVATPLRVVMPFTNHRQERRLALHREREVTLGGVAYGQRSTHTAPVTARRCTEGAIKSVTHAKSVSHVSPSTFEGLTDAEFACAFGNR